MADYLDVDLAIAEIDPVTKQIKATRYFENYLHAIIDNLGGEGSTTISDLVATTIDSGKSEYIFAQVKTLKRRIEELEAYFDSRQSVSQIKSLKRQVDEISSELCQPVLSAQTKQLQIDTASFNSRI